MINYARLAAGKSTVGFLNPAVRRLLEIPGWCGLTPGVVPDLRNGFRGDVHRHHGGWKRWVWDWGVQQCGRMGSSDGALLRLPLPAARGVALTFRIVRFQGLGTPNLAKLIPMFVALP